MKWSQLLLSLLIGIPALAHSAVWVDQGENAARSAVVMPAGRHFVADTLALRQQLESAPPEGTASPTPQLIELPMPDGSLALFEIVESPIMRAEMALGSPDIKTFKVTGVDDKTAFGRVNIGPGGFRGMILTSMGRVFIDPTGSSADASYVSEFAHRSERRNRFSCGVDHMIDRSPVAEFIDLRARGALARVEGRLLEYDLAVSATKEYAAVFGSDNTAVIAEIVNAIDRVNVFYERDLGIRLMLVGNVNASQNLIEQPTDDQFTESNLTVMFAENSDWLDAKIGTDGYDIGHVFSTQGGGLAFIGGVCNATLSPITNNRPKASGVTGLTNPTGDRFYVDYVAHEIGHQLGAEHTFNGTSVSCGGTNRVSDSAVEPGSGSTIMGYAGICGVEDLQNSSDATFHALSIAQIDAVVSTTGASCVSQTGLIGNSDPTVTAGANRTIPQGTPFFLDATGSDPDPGDALNLTYQWDQMDTGTATNAVTFGQDFGDNALFRTFEPRQDTSRQFPSMDTQVRGVFDDAEVLPCQDRQLNFQVTARDGNSGLGSDNVTLTVDKSSGPFRVTNYESPTTIFSTLGPVTLRWDVAGTNVAPVACSSVDIDLLTFSPGYTTYSEFPLLTTENDGEALVQITPVTKNAARARFRVSCSNNYFYDLSDADLQVTGTVPGDLFGTSDIQTYAGELGSTRGTIAQSCPEIGDSGGGGGGGVFNPLNDVIDLIQDEDADRAGGGSYVAAIVNLVLVVLLLVGLLKRRLRAGSAF